MKLKDYKMPLDGAAHDLDQGDLEQYNLKNFDLAQLKADPIFTSAVQDVIAPPPDGWPSFSPPPVVTTASVVSPPPSAPDPGPPNEDLLSAPTTTGPATPWDALAPSPLEDQLNQLVADPSVQAGTDFFLTGLAYNPFSPSPQESKIPRWFLATMGTFFVAGAALAITFCVVLLRTPNAAPAAQAPPTAPVVVAAAAAASQPSATDKAPVEAPRAVAPPEVRPSVPAVAMAVKQDAFAADHRSVVSRQAKVVRRQTSRPRLIADRGKTSSVEAATAKNRRPLDDLDRLLGETQ